MSVFLSLLASLSVSVFAMDVGLAPIQDVEVAERFSDKDDVVLRAEVLYPNGCYETLNSVDKHPTENKIVLKQKVMVRDGLCTMAIVHTQNYFNLSEHEEGTYNLVDAYDEEKLGVLKVDNQGNHEVTER